MTTLSLRLPNSLHAKIRQLAKEEAISINQFIASAATEKMASLLTESYLKKRASRADLKKLKLSWTKSRILSLKTMTD